MNQPPSLNNVFPFRLAPWLPARCASYLHWLRHLLERLGRTEALAIWQEACQPEADDLLRQIFGSGWQAATQDEALDADDAIDAAFSSVYPTAIQGVAPQEARRLVEMLPPIQQVRQTFPSLNVWKATTAYEALHLRLHGAPRLAEALLRRHGKQGELIAYDVLLAERIRAGAGAAGSVAAFIADFVAEPAEANLFSVGLAFDVLHASESEARLHVKECAWASYFRERHPQVGYLMACSTDEVAYRAFNPGLRLQRTTTLMEGGELCDFRVYVVDRAADIEKD